MRKKHYNSVLIIFLEDYYDAKFPVSFVISGRKFWEDVVDG